MNPEANLADMLSSVGVILCQETAQRFPQVPRADTRVSSTPAFSIATRRMWQAYREYRAMQPVGLKGLLRAWKARATFSRLSTAMRRTAITLKRAKIKDALLDL